MLEGILDRWTIIFTLVVLFFCWGLVWSYTAEPIGSFVAGALTAGLVLLLCVTFKLIFLTYKK